MSKNPPRLMHSELTGRWYIVTRYKVLNDEGDFVATTKYDVTDEIEKIQEDAREEGRESGMESAAELREMEQMDRD